MTRRLVRYMYRSASNAELVNLPWQEACTRFVQNAMSSYAGACQEKSWFYDLELGELFGKAAFEILAASKHPDRPTYKEVAEHAEREFQTWLDQTLHDKAMWIAVEDIFADKKTQDKVFTSLKKTYQVALNSALAERRPIDDLERLQIFLSKWMEDSLGRSWSAVGDGEATLNEEVGVKLFNALISPFGDEHPFSCIPGVLTEVIGRPPARWNFVRQQVTAIFRKWRAPAFKKKRKIGAVDMGDSVFTPPLRRRLAGGERPPEPDGDDELDELDEPGGHPECTSQEDCMGSPADRLWQHVLNGKSCDVYCATCWASFTAMSLELEGVELPP